MEKLMSKFFRIPVYHPKTTLVVLAVITLFACLGIPKLQFENSLDVMMPHEDREFIINENIKKIYGNNGKFIILDVSSDNLFTPAAFGEIDRLITDIDEYKFYNEERELSRIERINSLIAKNESITPQALLGSLSEDPAFARTVCRKLDTLNFSKSELSVRRLVKLKTALEKTREIKKNKYVDAALCPFTMKDISGKDDTLTPYDLMPKNKQGQRILPKTKKEFAQFEEKLRHNPAFEHGLYVRDTKTKKVTDFGVMVRLIDVSDHNLIARELWEVSQSYNHATSIHILAQGAPIMYKQITDYMQSDLMFFVPLVLIVICIIFFLNFRTAQGVFLPLITLLVADGWVLGLMGHLGYKMSVIGISLPPLIISVGSSYSIHIMNRFIIDSKSIAKEKQKGLHTSMEMIGMTLLLASVTTVIGFSTNMATQVTSIFEWGLFSAIGTAFAVIIAALFIPAMFNYMDVKVPRSFFASPRKVKNDQPGFIDRVLASCASLAVNNTRGVLIVTILIVALSVAGIVRLKTETSLASYFKSSDYINTSSCEIGRKFGGTMGLNILIDSGKADGAKDPVFLKKAEQLRVWLELPENADLHIGRTDAFGDFVKTMNMAMHNDDQRYFTIPDSEMDIMDYFEIYSGTDENSDGRVDEFEPYVDPAFRTINLFARLSESEGAMLGTSEISELVEKIQSHCDKVLLPAGYKVTISGEPLIIINLAKYIVRGQLWSLFLSLIAVSLVVVILFRSVKAGLISAIPISAAVLVNFGVMGWTGIRLDIATAIIASITVGIGVDNTIHFLNNYRHVNREKMPLDEAIIKTLAVGGKAIIFTALALIFGFSILVVSKFRPILLFGVMMGFTFIATTLGALLVLPAVIKVTKFRLKEEKDSVRLWRLNREAARSTISKIIAKNKRLYALNQYAQKKIHERKRTAANAIAEVQSQKKQPVKKVSTKKKPAKVKTVHTKKSVPAKKGKPAAPARNKKLKKGDIK